MGNRRVNSFVVAHPFNPVYLLPLVEICGGRKTPAASIHRAIDFFQHIGMYPLHVRKEIDGFIANRLLEALWREALWLVNDDVATVSEIDDAIRYGAGLRWALMGTFMVYRIGGGEDGIRHFMDQFGPALKWPWTKLMNVPELTDALINKITQQSDMQAGGVDLRELERRRDDGLVAILHALMSDGFTDHAQLETLDEATPFMSNSRSYRSKSRVVKGKEKDEMAASVASSPVSFIPDFCKYPVDYTIGSARPWTDGVQVHWSDDHVSRFHGLWLRDNCPCSNCINPVTREQIFDISMVDDDLAPMFVGTDGTGFLIVKWPGEHESRYHPGWLREHCYSSPYKKESKRISWGADLKIPTFDGQHVLEDDGALLTWLETLNTKGLALLKNCPLNQGAVEWFADRIAFLRETNFGRVFDVYSKQDPDSNAYTSLELPLHTDLPTRELQPGLQFLLCRVNQAVGGDSVMADGFRIAETMRTEEPGHFNILCTTPMEFRNRASNSDYRVRAPAIRLDENGDVTEIRFGNFLRGPFHAAEERMPSLYSAYRHLMGMTREDRFRVNFRLGPGDMVTFDNCRVLHARGAFDPNSGHRHLQGCYLDTDEIKSRIRVLNRTL